MEKPTMDAAAGAGAGGGGGGGIGRTKSEQLAPLQSLSRTPSAETVLSMPADATSLSRKPSFGRKRRSASVGGGNNRTHIRKSRSAQLKLDVEDLVSSGAALSRASSASLGFSFTFTGFTSPLQHMCSPDPPPPFSDDDDSRTHHLIHAYIYIYIKPVPLLIYIDQSIQAN
jgi:hypothetical protein